MADLAASAVSLYPTELGAAEFWPNGKGDRTLIGRRLKIVLTGQGGATNKITASALGFDKLVTCSPFTDDSGNTIYLTNVNPVTNIIEIVNDPLNATDIGDASATVYATVTGTPKVLAA